MDGRFPQVALVTLLAAAAGVVGALLTALRKTGFVDIGMAGNGAIGALVAITAPSGYVEPWAAIPIGFIAGIIVPLGVYAIDKKLDDPVGALTAHGLCGVWGTLSCGIFTSTRLAEFNAVGKPGLLYSGSFHQLGSQVLGIVVVFAFVFVHLLRGVLGDQEDLRAPCVGRGGGRRTGHLRARHVRVPGAVHPGARARGVHRHARQLRA